MNILLIGPFPPLRGGISDFNNELYKQLKKRNSIHLLTFSILYPTFLFPGKNQFFDNIKNSNIEKINPYNPLSYYKTYRFIKKIKPDLIITTHWNPIFSISYSLINRFSSKNIIKSGILHNIYSHEKNIFENIFLNFYLNSLDKLITLSDYTSKQIQKKNINCKSLFHPIPELNQNLSDRNKILKEKKLDPNKKYLLHFGLIRKYKGLDLLIKSLKKAIEKDNMIHLIIAGEFYDDIKKYEELILKLKLKNNITIENKFIKTENIYKWFSAADFIMQTNTSATQSGVSSLSIYFEKIMITTAAGGINETLNENNSFICEANTRSISNKILEAIKSNSNKKIDEIRKLKKKLNWNNFTEQIIEFIK